jgi:uncharacterized lipoprotein YmbA
MNSKLLSLTLLVMALLGCSSSGPATTYYGLFADKTLAAEFDACANSVGIGPVILPGYLKNPAIVSRSEGQQIRVSGYHAWAEPLDDAIARVLANNVSTLCDNHSQGFPWDSRARPELQVRVQIHQLDGVRGQELSLEASIQIFEQGKKAVLKDSAQVKLKHASTGSDYSNYTSAINTLLSKLSNSIAMEIAK